MLVKVEMDEELHIIQRNNINILGKGSQTIMLAHGFGCDQKMWRYLTPMLEDDFQIILFDYVGSGGSDYTSFNKQRYSTLNGYADDVVDICQSLNLNNTIFVGHSVSSMIGMRAAFQLDDSIISKLVMVCPSPCFLNFPPNYLGGFDKTDLEELINLMDKNYIGWANYLAPLVMGNNNDARLINELESSFCSTNPLYAKVFAKATFFADDRENLSKLAIPTLILQSEDDKLASVEIGQYLSKHIQHSKLNVVQSHGHCLHMTNPEQVYDAIKGFID